MRLIKFPPFHKIFQISKEPKAVGDDFPTIYLLGVFFVGLVGLASVAFPLLVFALVHFLYCSVLDHIDIYRYSLPGYSLAVLVGLDVVWSHAKIKANVRWLVACYALALIPYVASNLAGNRAPDDWLLSVMNRANAQRAS
jgi:hypothetical protein